MIYKYICLEGDIIKTINVVNGPQGVASIVLGCVRMPKLSVEEAETRFGEAFKRSGIKRQDVTIQTKCGLCFDRNEFDWTKENILNSVDDTLKRLQMDYIDILLLHRPDVIIEPEQVAEAFEILEKEGKVKYFGVSNVPPLQIELLKKFADKYGVSKTAIAIEWILRHPAKMQAIVGTMNPEHLEDIAGAKDVELTHHEWYELYLSAGKFLP